MIPYKKFPLTVVAIAVVLAAPLCIQNGALAQEARGSGLFEARERLDLLEFPGGTAAEFIEAVREAFGEVNIAASGAPELFTVPPLRLHNVTLGDVIPLLRHIAAYDAVEPGFWGDLSTSQVGATWVVSASVHRSPRGRPGQPAPPPPRAVTRVFSIMEILSEFNVDDIITSVETALTLETEAEPPEARQFTPDHPRYQAAMRARPGAPDVRLHEETGLLIVRGTPDQVATVESVVDALRDTAYTKQVEAQHIPRHEHEAVVHHLREVNRRLQEQLEALEAQLSELRGQTE